MEISGIYTLTTKMKTTPIITLSILILLSMPLFAKDITQERVAKIVQRGSQAMPFELDKTMHIFHKTEQGGIQQVIAKDESDIWQIDLVRKHLAEIAQQFTQRNFSGPEHIHGKNMPGLMELRNAGPNAIKIIYSELDNGAQIDYSSTKIKLVNAIHQWFDAHLKDHARHAMPGHHMHHNQ
jgi:hypothetical protein